MTDAAYTLLDFETEIFKRPVWRLDNVDRASDVIVEAQKQGVFLVSYREKGEEKELSNLSDAGFYPIETLTTLEKDLDVNAGFPASIRLSKPEDAKEVSNLARSCFTYDRYHADIEIPNQIADEIKARWMFNSVSERADAVFLYEEDGKILGFNACMFKDKTAVIDLIAVSADYKGRGIGRALVQAMASHYYGKAHTLRLGTQLSNETSQAFYNTLGFKEVAAHTTWHWVNKDLSYPI